MKNLKQRWTDLLSCEHVILKNLTASIGDEINGKPFEWHVQICQNCGMLIVSGHTNYERFRVRFHLNTDDTIETASIWANTIDEISDN